MPNPSKVRITGSSGRLGSRLVERFRDRGDEFAEDGINYLVFAHRYRGEPSFSHEIEANVQRVAHTIAKAAWAEGDKSIVLVSSVNAEEPSLNQSLAYNCSKAALNNMARYFAKSQPVRINTVSPNTFTGDSPAVTKDQVADVILFLCSPASSGINGQDLRVG